MKPSSAALALAAVLGVGVSPLAAQSLPEAELRLLDAHGSWLNPSRARASFSRTLPTELGGLGGPDNDALRFVVMGAPEVMSEPVGAVTLDARGAPLDALVSLPTEPSSCPEGTPPELVCSTTLPLRLVTDGLDRSHPAASSRSLRAELAGVLHVSLGRQTRLELPVGAPRELDGARFRARLRVLVLRSRRGGTPALGGSDAEARRLMQQELRGASAIWSQCGIDLGLGTSSTIDIVDPPPAALVNVGCGVGQPASGGQLRLGLGTRTVTLETRAGESPISATLRLAEALRERGKLPSVFENQRAADEAVPSAELLLNGRAAERAIIASSTDPSLPVCVGRLDLNDGLTHFTDADAFTGTLEERVLLRALDDHDPASVEVFVIPGFERGERIGESFIVSPGSSLENALIVDRSAISAGPRSFALAHELGHVLLAMPGHPDDFGVDQSWSLMDSDVADASIFGPRRLSLADCRRALTQTGPKSLVPILAPDPMK
jgi:hypothetical protein